MMKFLYGIMILLPNKILLYFNCVKSQALQWLPKDYLHMDLCFRLRQLHDFNVSYSTRFIINLDNILNYTMAVSQP